MTSVIAWIAAHQRRPSGLYFATDSRQTIELLNKEKKTYDDCEKIFIPEGTNEIFAFAGDATFPPKTLARLCSILKNEASTFNTLDEYEKSARAFKIINEDFDSLDKKPEHNFWILHGSRTGVMFNAKFHLFEYSFNRGGNSLEYGKLRSDSECSISLHLLGTGGSTVRRSINNESFYFSDVSRVQFSAFYEAIAGKTQPKDEWSGGPIQLAGILSIHTATHMGVVTPNGTYFRGKTSLPSNPEKFYWRNTNFENVDVTGKLRRGLQEFK